MLVSNIQKKLSCSKDPVSSIGHSSGSEGEMAGWSQSEERERYVNPEHLERARDSDFQKDGHTYDRKGTQHFVGVF